MSEESKAEPENIGVALMALAGQLAAEGAMSDREFRGCVMAIDKGAYGDAIDALAEAAYRQGPQPKGEACAFTFRQ